MLTLKDLDFAGKRTFVRVDFNVPLKDGRVQDDTRLVESLPTIEYLVKRKAKVILASHLGRPQGKPVAELSLAPVGEQLAQLLGRSVAFANDCVGPQAQTIVSRMQPGEVLLLENLRFHAQEEANQPAFAQALAQLAEIFVNEAFSASHRAHASVVGITQYLLSAAGFCLEKEVRVLGELLRKPEHPFILIAGGAKISDKIGVLENLLGRVDRLLVGGGMANTFLAAQGISLRDSLVEERALDDARRIAQKAAGKLVLPVDGIAADAFREDATRQAIRVEEVPPGWRILDIGPQTVELFRKYLVDARSILWNGPLGVWEMAAFAQGTWAIGRTLGEMVSATTVVGGGDLVGALKVGGVLSGISHVSTGGGAMLEFLEGKELPGIAALEKWGQKHGLDTKG